MPSSEIKLTIDVAGEKLDGLHLDQYFGVWAIEEGAFRSAINVFERFNLASHLASPAAQAVLTSDAPARGRGYAVTEDGVGILRLDGPLMKHLSSLSAGTSTVLARRALRAMAADKQVRSILLVIDSPGGTAAGTKDLADDVAAAAAVKPVHAFIEDLGASAAYWIASRASKVFAGEGALVGSIGTFAVVEDSSAEAAQLGVKVHVIRAGAHKGAGVPGTEVTPEQLAELQRIVNGINDHFLAGVSAGRKLSAERVRELADGRVHLARDAAGLGLIDGVSTFDQVLAALAASSNPKGKRMSQELPADTAPKAATHREIKAACPGCDNDFVIAQLDAGATLDQSMRAWMAEQNTRLAASKAETEKAKAAATKPGVEPLPNGGKAGAKASSGADPIEAFNEAVAEKMAAGMKKPKAIQAVVRENPELHESYIAAYNAAHQPSRGRRAG
jgi:signal peptide peptidase SppA